LRTESGQRRGRVFDLRATEVGGLWRVQELVVGRFGLLERLEAVRARRRRRTRGGHDTIPWDDVVRIRASVVVRDTVD
jgi:hypothetical protein